MKTPKFYTFNGWGNKLYGHKPTGNGYIATEWIVIFYIPVFPMKSYEVLGETGSWPQKSYQLKELPHRFKPQVIPIVILELVLLMLVILGGISGLSTKARVGQIAPDFTLALYPGYDAGYGQQITLSALRGKVVLIHFSTTMRFGAFDDETRWREQLWRKYKDQGLVVLGIFIFETEPDAVAYLTKFGVTYPNASDPNSAIRSQYDVTGTPETIIIARGGELISHQVGPQTQEKIEQILVPLLSK